MAAQGRRARIEDVHDLAMNMPHVSVIDGSNGNPVYQAGGRSFIFFRNPRPDATDPDTHMSVLIRGSQIGELTLAELTEVVQDAWLCRASARRAASWLTARGGADSHAGRPG
jgi:hypothetical protein